MTTEVVNLRVEDNAAENRFEVKVGDKFAFVIYHKHPGRITYYHTKVPPEFEGRGLAKMLAVHVLDYALENYLKE